MNILEKTEWVYYTIYEKLKFGLPEDQAIKRREKRAKSVLSELKNEIPKLLKIIDEVILCEDHMNSCIASKRLMDDDFNCNCFGDYYTLEETKDRAKSLLKELGYAL